MVIHTTVNLQELPCLPQHTCFNDHYAVTTVVSHAFSVAAPIARNSRLSVNTRSADCSFTASKSQTRI